MFFGWDSGLPLVYPVQSEIMKLYRLKIPEISAAVIERLANDEDIEVTPENRSEAEQDLTAIMEEFLAHGRDNPIWLRISGVR